MSVEAAPPSLLNVKAFRDSSALVHCGELGDKTQVVVDMGIMRPLQMPSLLSLLPRAESWRDFDFDSCPYADDDFMVEHRDAFQLLRIMAELGLARNEVIWHGASEPGSCVLPMPDQRQNTKLKTPAEIWSVMNVQNAARKPYSWFDWHSE